MKQQAIAFGLFCAALAGCSLLTAPAEKPWTVLFDGKNTAAFTAYGKDTFPAKGWTVEADGSLMVHGGAQAGDLVTRATYGDFELELDWKVSPGANSGIFYEVQDIPGKPVYWNAFECQVLDDDRHPDGKIPSHRAGALYDLYVPPAGATRPVGEWNHVRIVRQGSRIQQFLNGVKTVDADLASDDYKARFAKSKFHGWAGYGSHHTGRLGLQDHGDNVWFKNIRVRDLGPAAPK